MKTKIMLDSKFHQVLMDLEFLGTINLYLSKAIKLIFDDVVQNTSKMTFISSRGTELKIERCAANLIYSLEWDDPVAFQEFMILANSFNV